MHPYIKASHINTYIKPVCICVSHISMKSKVSLTEENNDNLKNNRVLTLLKLIQTHPYVHIHVL